MRCDTLRARGTGRAALAAASVKAKRDRAAIAAGLSAPMVTWARRIRAFGVPGLIAAVEDGRISLYVAARVARWSPEAQRELLDLPIDRFAVTLRVLRHPGSCAGVTRL